MVAYFKALNWSLVPSTVPILLVSTESVCSSHPPPLSPSLNLMRIDWLLSRTTRILMAAVTVVGCKCSSMNIMIQSKPSVLTSSSQALFKDRQVQRKGISFRNSDFKLVNFEPRFLRYHQFQGIYNIQDCQFSFFLVFEKDYYYI